MRKRYGETLGPAMKIHDQAEADAYFAVLVADVIKARAERGETSNLGEAEAIVRNALAYWAGYYDDETQVRVERLFGCNITPNSRQQQYCHCGWDLLKKMEGIGVVIQCPVCKLQWKKWVEV